MQDIAHSIGLDSVTRVVGLFYGRVREHPTLSVPFQRVHDWPLHVARIAHFWWVTLGGERYETFTYAVGQKHYESGFTPELLRDWLELFRTTLREQLAPDQAEAWIHRAETIGRSLALMHMHGYLSRSERAGEPHEHPPKA